MFLKKIKVYLKKQESLERTLFWMILTVVLVASLVSSIFTTYEGLSHKASIVCFFTFLACAAICIVAKKTKMYSQCYIVLCFLLNCLLMPLLYLFCGGIMSGMPLYFFTAIILCAYCQGNAKWITFFLSWISYAFIILFAKFYPEYVTQVTISAAFLDFFVSFFITTLVTFTIVTYGLRAYYKEKTDKEKKIKRLEYLSKYDSLTGLYSRNQIFNFINNIVWPQREKYYLLILDIDDLKKINQKQGHSFADKVVIGVSSIIKNNQKNEIGENGFRYDGDTFLSIIQADSKENAFAQAEKIREKVCQLGWIEFPDLNVSLSGGLVSCANHEYQDYDQAINNAELLLENAKSSGKNRILFDLDFAQIRNDKID